MIDQHEETAARKWIERQLRDGTNVKTLHEMVDQVARGVLDNALEAERHERHRADRAEVERDEARTELDRLTAAVAALNQTEPGETT